MPGLFRDRLLPLIVAVVFTTHSATAAGASWITIRNDTQQVIVLQELIVQDGQVKRLKPLRLLPGESVRQCEPSAGMKKFEAFDGKQPGGLLLSGELRVTDENQVFSIAESGGKTVLRAVPTTAPSTKRP